MKAILLFATLSMVLAMPCESAQTELESLRQLCQDQDQKIRHLESQLKQLGGGQTSAAASTNKGSEAARPAASDTYTVKAGDNIEKIARCNGCTATALYKLNGLKSSSVIHPGQRIKLPARTGIAAKESPARKSSPIVAAAEKPAESARIHKIKQGDTYSSLSRQYKIPVDTLIALNPGIKATALRPGINIRLNKGTTTTAAKQKATLAANESKTRSPLAPQSAKTIATTQKPAAPATSPTPAPEPVAKKNPTAQAPAPKTEAAMLPEAKTVAQSPGNAASAGQPVASAPLGNENTPPTPQADPNSKVERRIRSVKIDEPMTYGQFATQHGTDAERLNDLNGLDLTQATVLAKGSELYVPAQP